MMDPRPVTPSLARMENVCKSYNGRPALTDVTLAIAEREIIGLAGINGAGKSTLLKILLGLTSPRTGRVLFREQPVRSGAPRPVRIGFLPEETAVPADLTCAETIRFALRHRGEPAGARDARTDALLRQVGLATAGAVQARHCSKGMRRRLGLALALAAADDLLVLDEPQSGLDPLGRREFEGLIREFSSRGTAVLIASHDLAEIEALCDRVLLIHDGKLLRTWSRQDMDQSSLKNLFFDLLHPLRGVA